jgi:diguanylate cyclase (GGDEF)-like protein/PAS domain S-box-containing protein
MLERVAQFQKSSAGRSGEVRSSAGTPQMAGKTTVVIVDDRVTNRRIMSELASVLEENLEVKAFEDPIAALAWVEDNTPDLVITDYKMPHIDGAEFVRRFRRLPLCFDVPVVVVTVYEDKEFRYRALEAGATDFLLSPVDHHEFWSRSRNLLALRRQQQIIKHRAYSLERMLAQSHRLHEETVKEIQERLRSVIDAVPAMIYATDADLRLVFLNSYAAALTGVARETAIGSSAESVFGEAFGRMSEASDLTLFTTGETPPPFEERLVDARNRARDMLTSKSALRDPGGRITHAVTAAIDITERKDAEAARRESEEMLRGIAEHMPGTIFRRVLRPDGTVSYPYIGASAKTVYGIEPDEVMRDGGALLKVMHPEDREGYAASMHRSVEDLSPMEFEGRFMTLGGDPRWLKTISRPRRLDNGDVVWDGVILDVTDLKRAEAHRDYLAYHDQLTGLPNQSLFLDRMSQAITQAERSERIAAVLCLEIETLRNIRDSWGLAAADDIIRETAKRLRATLRPGDTVAHVGGGQFYALLCSIEKMSDVAVPLQKLVEAFELPFALNGEDVHIKAVMGVSAFPLDAREPGALMRNANTALDRAKALPTRRYEFYSAQMTEGAVRRMSLEAGLRRAIEDGQIEVFYQPQVGTNDYAIVGLEALARWRRPGNVLVSPYDFIPIAEQTGLIVPLGEHVLRTACEQAQAWLRAGLQLPSISVNVSGRQLLEEDFGEVVLAILSKTGFSPLNLRLELTESTIIRNAGVVSRIMDQLRSAGVTFAVDDFGIEHSALSHLSRLRVEMLKVDLSFVSQMTSDPDHAALVQAIVSMTHAMKKRAVAEGVETQEQLDYLRAYQCDALQGFLFSRPLAADRIGQLLKVGTIQPGQREI